MNCAKALCAIVFMLIGSRGSDLYCQGFDPSTAVAIPSTVLHGSDIEHVDLMSGALQVNIPLVHLKGRGIDLDITASYSSKVWQTYYYPDPYNTSILDESFGGTSSLGNGWSVGVPKMTSTVTGGISCPTADCLGGLLYLGQIVRMDGSTESVTNAEQITYTNPVWVTPLINCYLARAYCVGGAMVNPFSTWSYDGSYNIQQQGEYLKDGTHIANATYIQDDHYTTSQEIEDTNGNYIACGQVTNPPATICSDTLGRYVQLNTSPYSGAGQTLPLLSSVVYQDSNGNSQTITLSYSLMNIEYIWAAMDQPICDSGPNLTGFCSFYKGAAWLITSITFPSTSGSGPGPTYAFEYLDNGDGTTSGELSKITFPSGGYTRYTYMNLDPNHADMIASNRRVAQRFVSPDGTAAGEQPWTYNVGASYPTSQNDPPGTTVSVVDPVGNIHSETFVGQVGGISADTVLGFPPLLPVPGSVQSKDVDASGNILKIVSTTLGYDSSAFAVYDPFANVNNPRPMQVNTTLGGSTLQAVKNFTYGAYGNVSEEDDYDWATPGTLGSLLRTINKTYIADLNPVYSGNGAWIVDRVASETISQLGCVLRTCGSLQTAAYTSYTYDGYSSGRLAVGLAGESGVTQHDEVNYPISFLYRGNLTQVKKWTSTSGAVTLSDMSYDELGNVVASEDGNGNVTTFDYTDHYFGPQPSGATNAFVTQITKPSTNAVNHITRNQYYLGSGLLAANCGENYPLATPCVAQLSSPVSDYAWLSYDALGRINSENLGDGGNVQLVYSDVPLQTSVTQTKLMQAASGTTPAQSITQKMLYDGLGRQIQSQLVSDSSGISLVDFRYDPLGNLSYTSNPYRAGDSIYGVLSFYDALKRKYLVQEQDGATLRWTRTGSTIDQYDEVSTHTQSNIDALGRLTQVLELGTALLPISLSTSYTYDSLGNLTSVSQLGSGSSDVPRIRRFAYDALSRLTKACNPETVAQGSSCDGFHWSTTYNYDLNGNLQSKTDARGVVTGFTYDSLNRLISKNFTNDVSNTLSSCYSYDTAINGIGRLGSSWRQTGICSTNIPQTGILVSRTATLYDSVGRLKSERQCTPGNCNSIATGAYSLSYGYDLAGHNTYAEDGIGQASWFHQYDSAGRLLSTSANTGLPTTFYPSQLFSATATSQCPQAYTAAGALAGWTVGVNSGIPALSGCRHYDIRLRPSSETVLGHD